MARPTPARDSSAEAERGRADRREPLQRRASLPTMLDRVGSEMWDNGARRMNRILDLLAEKGAVFAARGLLILVAFAIAFLVAGWAQRGVIRVLARTRADATLGRFLANFLRYAIIASTLIACLGAIGFQTASFAALLGAAGIAIGLAFQSTLANFAAGIMLLLFRPFKVGDTVRIAGQTGTVRALDLFTTELVTGDNRKIILPNNAVFGQTVENTSYYATRRVDLNVHLPLRADAHKTEIALVAAARGVPGALAEPPADALLMELSDKTVWTVRVWCNTDDFSKVQAALAIALKDVVDTVPTRPA
jgi:small conductance mechanosensitive channel